VIAEPPVSPSLEEAVVVGLRRRGWTVGLAESVTAGGVAARLARVPGASDVLRGALVVYATDTKTAVAGVDERLLREEGPVAERVVEALAESARDRLGADVGLGIVGVAGPTEQGGERVGTVRVALALPGRPTVAHRFDLEARDRVAVQAAAVAAGLAALHRALGDAGGHATPRRS
jgi:PncC family amidohydrolase